ncbi:lipopolysaccharide biosynthesis protein [Novosphingobium tardum]|uniref:Lipopolysaccharide biosynthesis protein n=1 Tax=Novosphingobium tardum TaxID=1538021 RepID=A0ABV8RNY5_9SPHN
MSTFNRIGREYVAQVAAFVVALSDRLFIPAVFLRTLGVASFSAWSVAIAAGAFVSVLEFGVTRFYTNRLIALVEQNDHQAAHRMYREALTMIAVLVIFALTVIAVGFGYFVRGVGDPVLDRQLPFIAIPITLAAAVLQLLAVRQALYRAHRNFAVETWIRLGGEAARIAAVVLGALTGIGLLEIAWVWLGATIAFVFVPFSVHTRLLYRGFADRIGLPRGAEFVSMSRLAPGLWLQSMFMTLYATLPVMAIGALTAAPALIAQFVLMRTIANFVRQILQMFANVFGIELARRHAVGDHAGFAQVFGETNRFLAVQTAVATGALFVLGQPLFTVWTGKPELFDETMLLFAVLPPVLMPATMLSIEALAYANRPWPIVRGRVVQLVVSVALFFVLPAQNPALRMTEALAIGEIVGLSFPLMIAIGRFNPLIRMRSAAMLLVYSGLAFAVTVAMVAPVWLCPELGTLARVALGGAMATVSLVTCHALFGMTAVRRRSIVGMVQRALG